MKLKKHLFDLIKVNILSRLGHKPELLRQAPTVEVGKVYRLYGNLVKAVPLTDEDRDIIKIFREHPEQAIVTTPEGNAIEAPDARCAICPLFIEGIVCRNECQECENIKYIIIKKQSNNGK